MARKQTIKVQQPVAADEAPKPATNERALQLAMGQKKD